MFISRAIESYLRPPTEPPCHCARCADRTDRAEPATAEQAAQSGFPQIGEGDLICPACAEVLTADATDAALSADPACAEVAEERHAGYLARLEADLSAEAALPWGPQWIEADALCGAVAA